MINFNFASSKPTLRSCKKRPILLLEVLIAFAIIVLCIFPLIYPHAAMARAQREFIKKIELDHAVTLLFAQIYQDLLTNKIQWEDIEGKRKFEVTPLELQKLNKGSQLPFAGYYRFEPVIHKPKSQTPQETTAYIFDLVLKFHPSMEGKKIRLKGQSKKSQKYKYKIFLLRDLRPAKEPVKQEAENEKNEA